nr:hypothetical protein HK105_005517 [Polyrhizophydium stewartii]
MHRYPKQDWHDIGKFPAYVPMIITEETGAKFYGTCIVVHERPKGKLYSQLDSLMSEWLKNNLAESDIEYVQHVQTQLAFHKEKLAKIRSSRDGLNERELRELVAAEEEKIAIYEEVLSPLKQTILARLEHVYVPRCLGVLSHWPWYNLFKDWLCELVRMLRNPKDSKCFAPLERCLVNLIHEIPLPPPGKLEIALSIGQLQLYCARPPVNTISVLKNYSLYPLFRCMSIHHIVLLFELALTERKIILVSSHYSMLNLVSEAVCQLIYLQAPMPYVVGVNRKYFSPSVRDEWRPQDAAVVDIDNDAVDLGQPMIGLPSRERRKLVARLEKYAPLFAAQQGSRGLDEAPAPFTSSRGVPLSMQVAFPGNKHAVLTGDSHIGLRKVQDIPKSMYARFSNDFLQAKSHVARRMSIHQQQQQQQQQRQRPSVFQAEPLVPAVSQSFDNLGPGNAFAIGSAAGRPPRPLAPKSGSISNMSISLTINTSGSIVQEDSAHVLSGLAEHEAEQQESPANSDLTQSSGGSNLLAKNRAAQPPSSSSSPDRTQANRSVWSSPPAAIVVPSTPSDAAATGGPASATSNASDPNDDSRARSGASLEQPRPTIKSAATWWSTGRSETLSATTATPSGAGARSPGVASFFGAFSMSAPGSGAAAGAGAGAGASARVRQRPSSAGTDSMLRRPSSTSMDSPSRTSAEPTFAQSSTSTSPRKNVLLARFFGSSAQTGVAANAAGQNASGSSSMNASASGSRNPLSSSLSSRSLPLSPRLNPLNHAKAAVDAGDDGALPSGSAASQGDAIPPVRTIYKEGHIFHELIPVAPQAPLSTDRLADIGSDDGSEAPRRRNSSLYVHSGAQVEANGDAGSATQSGAADDALSALDTSDASALDSPASGAASAGAVASTTGAAPSTSASTAKASAAESQAEGIAHQIAHGRSSNAGYNAADAIEFNDDELADRFGVDSQSSEDYTRSEVSTDVRSQSSRFALGGRRPAGSAAGSVAGHSNVIRRSSGFGSTLVLSRRETVRGVGAPTCRMCREDLNARKDKILMCECGCDARSCPP